MGRRRMGRGGMDEEGWDGEGGMIRREWDGEG